VREQKLEMTSLDDSQYSGEDMSGPAKKWNMIGDQALLKDIDNYDPQIDTYGTPS
jgi:hypothetical protein